MNLYAYSTWFSGKPNLAAIDPCSGRTHKGDETSKLITMKIINWME
jgi:hypothetical protein